MAMFTVCGVVDMTVSPPVLTVAAVLPGRVPVVDGPEGLRHARRWVGAVEASDALVAEAVAAELVSRMDLGEPGAGAEDATAH